MQHVFVPSKLPFLPHELLYYLEMYIVNIAQKDLCFHDTRLMITNIILWMTKEKNIMKYFTLSEHIEKMCKYV